MQVLSVSMFNCQSRSRYNFFCVHLFNVALSHHPREATTHLVRTGWGMPTRPRCWAGWVQDSHDPHLSLASVLGLCLRLLGYPRDHLGFPLAGNWSAVCSFPGQSPTLESSRIPESMYIKLCDLSVINKTKGNCK